MSRKGAFIVVSVGLLAIIWSTIYFSPQLMDRLRASLSPRPDPIFETEKDIKAKMKDLIYVQDQLVQQLKSRLADQNIKIDLLESEKKSLQDQLTKAQEEAKTQKRVVVLTKATSPPQSNPYGLTDAQLKLLRKYPQKYPRP